MMNLNIFRFFFKQTDKPLFPEVGKKIRITYLPSCKNVVSGTPNPYIGMEGFVDNLKSDGSFDLYTGTSWLIISNNKYKFIYI